MNTDKVYDCNMFGQIAKGLKFHNRHDFVELLIRCKGFGFIWKDDEAAMLTEIYWLSTLPSGMSPKLRI